jgi:hypothetical protein
MIHLLDRAAAHRTDPAIFVGLVHACRYCGQCQASLAADAMARRLDPTARTSVGYTHWMRGEYQSALGDALDYLSFLRPYSLAASGRIEEAIKAYRESEGTLTLEVARALFTSQRAALEGNREESLGAIRRMVASGFRDPEGLYFLARTAAFLGEADEGIALLARVIGHGFYCDRTLREDRWLDGIRSREEFAQLTAEAEAGRKRAAAAYREHDGDRILGVPPDS